MTVWGRFVFCGAFFSMMLAVPLSSKALTTDLSGLPRARAVSASPVDMQYRRGLDALNINDLAAADAAFREGLKTNASHYPSLLGLAHVAVKRNQAKDAEAWLQKALAAAPENAEVQVSWGRYQRFQKQFGKAEAAFKKAISLDFGAFIPRIDLADLYLESMNKPKEAAEAYRAALAIDPNHGGAHYGLATALLRTGLADAAVKEFETSGKFSPGNPLPWRALGQLYLGQRQYDKALEAANRALKEQPGYSPALVMRGDVYASKGDDGKAVEAYQAALKASPKYSLAHMQLASTYQRLKRYPEAEQGYLAAIEGEPNNAMAYNNLAWMAAERKVRLDDALIWAKKAVQLVPAQVQFQDTLGWVYHARGELDKAVQTLSKAASIKPPVAEIHYHLGVVYQEQNKQKEAVAELKKAIEIQEDYPEAVTLLRQLEGRR